MKRKERHAVYAVTDNAKGDAVAFRVGQPVDWHTAQNRYERLCVRRAAGAKVRIKHDQRVYRARWFEVRAVDKHGRGLGSERHMTAIVVPYRAVRSAKR